MATPIISDEGLYILTPVSYYSMLSLTRQSIIGGIIMAKKKSGIVKAAVGIGAVVVAGKVAYEKYKTTKSRYTKEEQDSADLEVRKYNAICEKKVVEVEDEEFVGCEIKSVASNTTLDLGLAVFEKDVYINFESVCSNVTIILPEGVNVACDIEKRIAGVHNLVENVDEEGIHTVYVIGKATLSSVDIIPVNFYVDEDDVEDILAEDDFDDEEAFPESEDIDVKVINKSEKEAVSEETVKSEDGAKSEETANTEDGVKSEDNADTTEDSTETINLEEVK